MQFPLATTSWGYFQQSATNKEFLSIPVSLTLALTPNVAVAVAAALNGPLESTGSSGGFGDVYTIPVGAAVVVTPDRHIDVGAGFTFLNLFGKDTSTASRTDLRALQGFISYRL